MSNKFLYINLILKTMIWETPTTAHHPPETFKVNRLDISGSRLDTTKHYSWSRSGLPLFFGSNPNQTLQFLWVDPLLSRSQTTYTDLNRLKQDELDTSDLSLVTQYVLVILSKRPPPSPTMKSRVFKYTSHWLSWVWECFIQFRL